MTALLAFFLDFGLATSPVMPGWQGLGPATVATAAAPGWVAPADYKGQDRAWTWDAKEVLSNNKAAPPVYTNDLTRDAVTGSGEAKLQLPLPAGEYELWVCGGSSERSRAQVYDFTVTAGEASAHFQMAGGYWFEARRLRFKTTGNPSVTVTSPSRWILSALAVYPVADAARAKELIEPTEQLVYLLPPELLKDWQRDEHADPVGQMPPPRDSDRARGYVVHHRHYLENVWPNTVPYAAEVDPALEAFASLGEFEPLTFTVLPLKALSGCRVEVGELTGPGTIGRERIDVKMVQYANSRPHYTFIRRYKLTPDYLRPFDTVDLPAEVNQRFWLTVHVPDDARPGLYRGTVTFRPTGAPAATIPIRFRVLDLRLKSDPTKIYGIYYRDPLDEAGYAPDDFSRQFYERQAELQAQDMNDHGTVLCVPMSVWISVPGKPETPLQFTYDWDKLVKKIDRCKRYGYPGPYIMSLNTGGLYARHMNGASLGSHIADAKPAPPEFERELTEMIGWIEAGRKERGLPEFVYYPIDEPGGAPDQVKFMLQCLKAIRDGGGRTYVTADPTADSRAPMMPFVDIWCTQPFLPEREPLLADMAKRPVEYWCYPNHVNGENDHTTVAGARMTYGFGFWRSGFLALIPWIYSSTSAHPFNNLDGGYADFFNRPGPDGTVWPVPMWEAYREGWDDYRYVYTLEQLTAAAEKAKLKEAAAARRVLDETWNAVEVKAKYKLDGDVWGYREFDLRRWRIAEQLLKLQAAR